MEPNAELKVFTLPSCAVCSVAKTIAKEVAEEFSISFREVNMATEEGFREGSTYGVLSVPSIALGGEVIASGYLIPKEKLRKEVAKRIAKRVKS